MRLPWPSRRHSHWQEDVDAYVDGELDARAAARLETHLDTCEACREMVVARREAKRLVATLPEMAAPRSFRITPGMLVEERRTPEAGRGATIVMRPGQATAGVAALAFAAVLVAHLSSGTNDGGDRQAADAEAQTMSISEAAGGSPAAADADAQAPSPEPTRAVPEFGSGTVGGASNPPASASSTANDDSVRSSDLRDKDAPTSNTAGAPQTDVDPARASKDGDSDQGFLVAEAALSGLLIVGIGAWIFARRGRSA